MAEHIKVERIEIKIGKKVLSLTPVEMKELRDVLNQTFPAYIASSPVVIERPVYPRLPYWRPLWCEGQETRYTDNIGQWSGTGTLRLECKS